MRIKNTYNGKQRKKHIIMQIQRTFSFSIGKNELLFPNQYENSIKETPCGYDIVAALIKAYSTVEHFSQA